MAVKLRWWLEFIREEYADMPAVGAILIVITSLAAVAILYTLGFVLWVGRPVSFAAAGVVVVLYRWSYRWMKGRR